MILVLAEPVRSGTEWIPVATAAILGIAGLIAALNYLIRQSSLLANTVWELTEYGFKRGEQE